MKLTKSKLKQMIKEELGSINEEESNPIGDLKNIIEGLESNQAQERPADLSDTIISLWDIYERLVNERGVQGWDAGKVGMSGREWDD